MKVEQIDRVLETLAGTKRDGQAYLISDESELSVFVALPAEVLAVGRVVRIERSGDLAILDTAAGDRYHVAAQDIAMIKISASAKKGVGVRATGFR